MARNPWEICMRPLALPLGVVPVVFPSGGDFMREFLASVLTVIAMGVLLIAYTLSGSRAAAAPAGLVQYDPRAEGYQFARPAFAERVELTGDPYAGYAVRTPVTYPMNTARPVAAYDPYAQTAQAPRRVVTSTRARTTAQVERRAGRDWKRTAMVVGGSTAAGAGVGALIGGKKGALVGAALGGGASTLYEATKR
jgi:hypothetical protein